MKATAKSGYEFSNWSIDGKIVSNSTTYSFIVTGKTTVKAVFTKAKTLKSIKISGASSIENDKSSNYTCTATWSDGSTTTVTPTWSLSSTTYASVTTVGVVTNKNTNTSAKTVTLKASYSGKSTSKSISLKGMTAKTLKSIKISSPTSIEYDNSETYTCTATWSDGSTTTVNPTWSLSSTTYASVTTGGVVTNKNTKTTATTVTLKAKYSGKSDSKSISLKGKTGKTLKSIEISGPSSIENGKSAAYTCTATWSDGSTTTVTPTWSLSATTCASVTTGGLVTNKNTKTSATTVTLKAKHSGKSATMSISLKGKTSKIMTPKSIKISGPSFIENGKSATYTCTATWSDGSTSTVTPTWSLSSKTYAGVTTGGVVSNKNTKSSATNVKLTATYSSVISKTSPKTVTDSLTITLEQLRTLKGLTIHGASSIEYSQSSSYTCVATWSDGTNTTVTPTWSLSSNTYASVTKDGLVSNKNTTTSSQTMALKASYLGKTDSWSIKLKGYTLPVATPTASKGSYSYVHISWSAMAGVKRYVIMRGTSSTYSKASQLAIVTTTSYSDTSAVAGVRYYYWVCSALPTGSGFFYNESKYDYGFSKNISPEPGPDPGPGTGYISGPTSVKYSQTANYKLYVGGKNVTSSASWKSAPCMTSHGGGRYFVGNPPSNGTTSRVQAVYNGKPYSLSVRVYK